VPAPSYRKVNWVGQAKGTGRRSEAGDMSEASGDGSVGTLTARTRALEMIVTRLAAQWANDREEPRRAAERLTEELLAATGEADEAVAEQIRRFGALLDERLSLKDDRL
jgi:hypothetical protein